MCYLAWGAYGWKSTEVRDYLNPVVLEFDRPRDLGLCPAGAAI